VVAQVTAGIERFLPERPSFSHGTEPAWIIRDAEDASEEALIGYASCIAQATAGLECFLRQQHSFSHGTEPAWSTRDAEHASEEALIGYASCLLSPLNKTKAPKGN
jgi:hypothetical protein